MTDEPTESLVERFRRSMVMDFDKWHDGVGYDLDALGTAGDAERKAIEDMLIEHGVDDWRVVEALALLDTPRAQAALRSALKSHDLTVRLAIIEHAPHLAPDEERTASLVAAVNDAEAFGGLSKTIDQIEEFHPPEVIDALFRATLERDGETAVHYAALLMFLHGKADSSFDWEQRPFFLRFNTDVRRERAKAFRELCEKVGVEATPYLLQHARRER
jgi:HEAT repeat protein